MEKINAQYSFKEILDLYKWRIYWINQASVKEENLNIEDKEDFETNLIQAAAWFVDRYKNLENEMEWIKSTDPHWEIIDYSMISEIRTHQATFLLKITKSFFRRDWFTWNPSEKLCLELHNSNGNPLSNKENEIWELMFLPFDWIFDLDHRWIEPRYQKHWMGTSLLKSAESFLSNLAETTKEDISIRADVGQLNVMLWFLKNWYKFETKQDEKHFNEIINWNPELCIWEDYYVFSKEIPFSERTASNRFNAKNVAFIKPISKRNESKEVIENIVQWLDFPTYIRS